MLWRLCRTVLRGFSQTIQKSEPAWVVEQGESKLQEVPVYLQPYNRAKYEVPLKKIKLNSGYAFLEVEPFPRSKIMKICYHVLQQLSIGFPENSVYRIFNEERTKYFMKLVDQTEDIEDLEDIFGVETIELFIDNLAGQLEIINIMREKRVWEIEDTDEYQPDFLEDAFPDKEEKYPAYKKTDRPKSKFVEQ